MDAGSPSALGSFVFRFCQISSVTKGMKGCSSRKVRSRTWASTGNGDGSPPARSLILAISMYQSQYSCHTKS